MPPKALSTITVDKLVLAKVRGFCAGVVRAIEVVERALVLCGGKVYVRHEIIHNRYVVEELHKKGAVFVEELSEVPEGSWLIFSAHGVGPDVVAEAKSRRFKIIDATCPLVTKVHLEAIALAKQAYTIILIGHRDHVETIGTLGEAPEHMVVVGNVKEAETISVPTPDKVAYLTQTTLSLDDTREIVSALRRRFPKLVAPKKDDICYATQNRQNAVKAIVPQVDLLLVLGAPNSSNSNRLCEVARSKGIRSHLIERAADIKDEWLEGVKTLGLTSGASAPEILVQEVVTLCKDRYCVASVEELETVVETEHFGLPYEIVNLVKAKEGA
ncbi:MAG: 4-hydroxy-3-methylbut-2-enyl diphosphate reductase [Elusimicrobia bacterium GWC2_65_9]|nr:MAG: 4-hydroxy-3-methylbut-2-enyl diphosphate reductase [Elusimicrobia bacterium GWA2_66_18]OGR70686.1 MAG: 4-hydroxy-3-methylbut-2-enyl diphosphate reductase [Elusimicrobia bacterium GWC2_65_9]